MLSQCWLIRLPTYLLELRWSLKPMLMLVEVILQLAGFVRFALLSIICTHTHARTLVRPLGKIDCLKPVYIHAENVRKNIYDIKWYNDGCMQHKNAKRRRTTGQGRRAQQSSEADTTRRSTANGRYEIENINTNDAKGERDFVFYTREGDRWSERARATQMACVCACSRCQFSITKKNMCSILKYVFLHLSFFAFCISCSI